MSNTLTNSQNHRAARNAASIAMADGAAGAVDPASVRLYTAQGGDLLAIVYLAEPCGEIRPSDGRIELAQATGVSQGVGQGGATWGAWCDGSGNPLSWGDVTDVAGNYTDADGNVVAHPDGVGAFVVGGSTGTNVYLGGVVTLYTAVIG